jgi:3-oxoacyl-(acyl-carrier-protein) synthase
VRSSPQERVSVEVPPGLAVLAESYWDDAQTVPQVGRFSGSDFAPLVVTVAERCLRQRHGEPPLPPPYDERTALVLASVCADVTTIDTVAAAVTEGQPPPKPCFVTSVPTAGPGHIAAVWSLTGPVQTIIAISGTGRDGTALAARLIAGDEADEVLVVTTDLPDRAHAVLLAAAPR